MADTQYPGHEAIRIWFSDVVAGRYGRFNRLSIERAAANLQHASPQLAHCTQKQIIARLLAGERLATERALYRVQAKESTRASGCP